MRLLISLAVAVVADTSAPFWIPFDAGVKEGVEAKLVSVEGTLDKKLELLLLTVECTEFFLKLLPSDLVLSIMS